MCWCQQFITFFFSLLLQALSKTLTVDELFYLREQYALLEPNKSGTISLENVKVVGFFPYVSLFKLYVVNYALTFLLLSGLDEICNRCYEGVTSP